MIDVVLPTVTGREESLARAIESYERNTPDLNLIVIQDLETVGLAWQEGTKQGSAPYVHLSCDDLEMTSATWSEHCVRVADADKLPCPTIFRPDGSLESCGGDMNEPACLHSQIWPPGTEVDFTVLPFGTREQVEAIGMLDIHYASDVWFSRRGRQLGWPTVITRGYELTHHRSDIKRKSSSPSEMAAVERELSSS